MTPEQIRLVIDQAFAILERATTSRWELRALVVALHLMALSFLPSITQEIREVESREGKKSQLRQSRPLGTAATSEGRVAQLVEEP